MEKQFRYTDKEFEIISNSFADNPDLLMTIRKHFLQGDLLEADKIELDKMVKSDMLPVLRKVLLPELDAESTLNQNVDMWSNINTKENPDMAHLDIMARKIVITYLEDRFRILEGKESILKAGLNDLTPYARNGNKESIFIELSARNTILQHIDFQLSSLLIIAGQNRESAEEIKKRLKKDSSK